MLGYGWFQDVVGGVRSHQPDNEIFIILNRCDETDQSTLVEIEIDP